MVDTVLERTAFYSFLQNYVNRLSQDLFNGNAKTNWIFLPSNCNLVHVVSTSFKNQVFIELLDVCKFTL